MWKTSMRWRPLARSSVRCWASAACRPWASRRSRRTAMARPPSSARRASSNMLPPCCTPNWARRCPAGPAQGPPSFPPIPPDQAHSYGKAAIVGEAGELEHAAAVLHPKLGAALRSVLGKGAAIVPSSKKIGGLGTAIDVPLGHKDAAYVRSHFDAIEARVADAPRANEIVVAIAVTDSGRPLPRIGGLDAAGIQGLDGLR